MDRNQVKKDILMWAFFFAFGIMMAFVIIPKQIPVSAMLAKEYITPRSFPTAICLALSLVSFVGLASSIRKFLRIQKEARAENAAEADRERSLYDSIFPFLIFALIVVYAVMFKRLGFIWATAIIPPIILALLKCRKWYMYLALYAFAAIIYILFTVVLNVPLP